MELNCLVGMGGFGVWESSKFLQEIHNTEMLDVFSSFIEIL